MRKYHPDRFPGDEAKREAATKLAAAINEAYQKLEDHLKALGDKG
jgi:curved DNA-binding protein CbpA